LIEADVEHRLKPEESSLLKADLTLFPDRAWSLAASGRYEFKESRLEEQNVHLRRNFDCMVLRIGGGIIPGYRLADGSRAGDEWHATVELWLTAFPETAMRMASGDVR
jgi:hypothetical protein